MVILPRAVNFAALLRRFSKTCLMRMLSPYSSLGRSGETSRISSTSFSFNLVMTIFATSYTMDIGSYFTSLTSILPDSIFVKSRISLIIVSSDLPASLIWLIYSLATGGSSSLRAISAIPITAFMGVLISWLILARKSDFIFPDFSSSLFAR